MSDIDPGKLNDLDVVNVAVAAIHSLIIANCPDGHVRHRALAALDTAHAHALRAVRTGTPDLSTVVVARIDESAAQALRDGKASLGVG